MSFTPRIKIRRFFGGFLATAVVGLTPWGGNAASPPISFAVEQSVQANSYYLAESAPGLQMAGSDLYQPVASWSQTKHWAKRNAPILGGAGGGALVGGLVGGGKGALVGGALGAGGGYLYKRHEQHHRYEHYRAENRRNDYYDHNHNYYQHQR